MVTLKADDKRRVALPDAKPGQVFAYEYTGNMVKLTPVKPVEEDAPLVKMIRRADGSYAFPPDIKITRKQIIAAIRADRDSR